MTIKHQQHLNSFVTKRNTITIKYSPTKEHHSVIMRTLKKSSLKKHYLHFSASSKLMAIENHTAIKSKSSIQ